MEERFDNNFRMVKMKYCEAGKYIKWLWGDDIFIGINEHDYDSLENHHERVLNRFGGWKPYSIWWGKSKVNPESETYLDGITIAEKKDLELIYGKEIQFSNGTPVAYIPIKCYDADKGFVSMVCPTVYKYLKGTK